MNTYKNQIWPVRVLKWMQWKPRYWLAGLGSTARWIFLLNAQIPKEEKKFFKGKWDYICHLFRCELSMADVKMGNYQTLDEVIAELRKKVACQQ